MSAALKAVLTAFFAAFASAFEDWLQDRQANADAKSVGSLNSQLGGANAEIELQREDKAIAATAAAMTDDAAREEAMTWAS